jgi:hypothetical protein
VKEIILCFGPEINSNKAALESLEKLKQARNVQLRTVGDTVLLADYVDLPYIQVDEGRRFYGLESIQKFVDRELTNKE